MPRAAGDSHHYQFVLKNLGTGKYDTDTIIKFISVTTVIGKVLSKPMLIDWSARVTREGIATLVSSKEVIEPMLVDGNLYDVLSDPEWCQELLTANKLRWQDITDEAADRGKAEHNTLETIANLALKGDDGDADALAKKIWASSTATGFAKATARWWLDTEPKVIASEKFVYSLKHRFAGTVDLITEDAIIDLKSRANHLGAYDSDHIQVGAYGIALFDMGEKLPDKRMVLVIHENGTYSYEERVFPPAVFLNLLAVYNTLYAKQGGE